MKSTNGKARTLRIIPGAELFRDKVNREIWSSQRHRLIVRNGNTERLLPTHYNFDCIEAHS